MEPLGDFPRRCRCSLRMTPSPCGAAIQRGDSLVPRSPALTCTHLSSSSESGRPGAAAARPSGPQVPRPRYRPPARRLRAGSLRTRQAAPPQPHGAQVTPMPRPLPRPSWRPRPVLAAARMHPGKCRRLDPPLSLAPQLPEESTTSPSMLRDQRRRRRATAAEAFRNGS